MQLSDWIPRMQCENSEPFGEEIILLYLLFSLNLTMVRTFNQKLLANRLLG